MAQRVIVQDGNIAYSRSDPSLDVNMSVAGQLNVATDLNVGDPTSAIPGNISSALDLDLYIYGGNNSAGSSGNLYLSGSPLGTVYINGLAWPTTTGTSGQVLTSDGAGNIIWSNGGGSGATPGGNNLDIQYNNSGVFGGADTFQFNPSTLQMAIIGGSSDYPQIQGYPSLSLIGGNGTDGQVLIGNLGSVGSFGNIFGINFIPSGTYGSSLIMASNGGYWIDANNSAGTSGQVWTSQGATLPPIWQSVPSSGVTSFNTRTGAITLTSADVTTALGYTPGSGSGTVTSVGLTSPGVLYTVSGSPITTNGVLSLNLISQTANTFLAAPNGSLGTPNFRAIVAADIPTLNQNTTGNAATATLSTSSTNLAGGTAMSIPYQSAPGTTAFLPAGTSGQVLTTQGTSTSPIWATPTATNLTGGTAGEIPYQSAANTTAFTAAGSSGQVLQSTGTGAPIWVSPSSFGFNPLRYAAVTTLSPTTSDAFIGGPTALILIPANTITITPSASTYQITMAGVYNAAASNTITFNVRMGSTGTLSDNSLLTFSLSNPSNAALVPFKVEIIVMFNATGTTSHPAVNAMVQSSGTTGLGGQPITGFSTQSSTGTVNTTLANYLFVSWSASASLINTNTTTYSIIQVN